MEANTAPRTTQSPIISRRRSKRSSAQPAASPPTATGAVYRTARRGRLARAVPRARPTSATQLAASPAADTVAPAHTRRNAGIDRAVVVCRIGAGYETGAPGRYTKSAPPLVPRRAPHSCRPGATRAARVPVRAAPATRPNARLPRGEGRGAVAARCHAVGAAERRVEAGDTAEAAGEADVGHRRAGAAQQPRGVAGPQLDDVTVRGDPGHVAEQVHEAGPAQPERPRLRDQIKVRV